MASEGDSRVPESALGEATDHCALCGFEGDRSPALRVQTVPIVEFLECPKCESLCASRLPSADHLASLYDPDHYASSLVSAPSLSKRCAEEILEHCAFSPSRKLSIVDYGGSDGTLSAAMRKRLIESGHTAQVESQVVDLFPREDTPHQRFVTPEDFEKSTAQHDLILASAVLEHLPEPAPVIRSLLDHAEAGAHFYARTPWDAPLHRTVPGYRVKWPRHLHDIGPVFWERFSEIFGRELEVVFSRPSIVESSFEVAPLYTLAAHLLKAPARIEERWLRPVLGHRTHLWRLVGGWEVLFRLR